MFTAPPFEITPEILNLVAAVDQFKGTWQASKPLPPERLAALKRLATTAGIAASLRIEAIQQPDAHEMAAYAAVLDRIFRDHNALPLSGALIRQWHSDLLPHAPAARGYKTETTDIAALDDSGHPVGLAFETAPPADTPRRMRDLIRWTKAELASKALHPLLVIAFFVLTFVEIHPFEAGNGRLSRVLAVLLLCRTGYDYMPYCALEAMLEDDKDGYFAAVLAIQSEAFDWQPWLLVFLGALHRQTEYLAAWLADPVPAQPSSDLSRNILAYATTHKRVTLADLVALTGANRNTLKVHLAQLLETRHLTLHGAGRGAWYSPS